MLVKKIATLSKTPGVMNIHNIHNLYDEATELQMFTLYFFYIYFTVMNKHYYESYAIFYSLFSFMTSLK